MLYSEFKIISEIIPVFAHKFRLYAIVLFKYRIKIGFVRKSRFPDYGIYGILGCEHQVYHIVKTLFYQKLLEAQTAIFL